MRYALIADIHGNLPALEAVLADGDTRESVNAVYHLGDLGGYAPWPNEVVATLQDRGITGIAGNYDSTVATDYEHCGCKAETPRQEEHSHLSYGWTLSQVTPETKQYLGGAALQDGPETPRRAQVSPPDHPRARNTHPQHPLLDRGPSRLLLLEDGPGCGRQGGDLIAFGHTHKPWHRVVEGVHFLNTGSVGKPKDGEWRAGYVLVEAGEEIGPVEFVRVKYDLERAVEGVRGSELPDEFADQLIAGGTPKPVEIA